MKTKLVWDWEAGDFIEVAVPDTEGMPTLMDLAIRQLENEQ